MIDIDEAKKTFQKYIDNYNNKEDLSFKLKVVHTYKVLDNAKYIAQKLNLSEEDRKLAELIAVLHDIGRFEQITKYKRFNNTDFNHALYGVKILFKDGLIREFITDNKYDNIIKIAIENHNLLKIEDNINGKELLHAKIIRDADKLDNFRVMAEEKVGNIFPNVVVDINEVETSEISDKVYNNVKNEECINIKDRKTKLDYYICGLAFVFDLNFKESFIKVKKDNYINRFIDKFNYKNEETKKRMENIRKILNDYIDKNINNN